MSENFEIPSNLTTQFLEKIASVAPNVLYVFDLETMENVWSNRSLPKHIGYSEQEVLDMGENFLPNLMHPEDLERYPKHFERLVALGPNETAVFEYRMLHKEGHWVWLHSEEAPYLRNSEGRVKQIIGSAHDVSELKAASERVELVSGELRHRVKNIFTISNALLSISERDGDPDSAFRTARSRINALANAHEIAMRDADSGKLNVAELVTETLKPYQRLGRLSMSIQDVRLPGRLATPLGLILHELATNSLKYGAFKAEDGKVSVAVKVETSDVLFDWNESISPPLAGVPQASGFGTRLMNQAAAQLGSVIERQLNTDGLCFSLRFAAGQGL